MHIYCTFHIILFQKYLKVYFCFILHVFVFVCTYICVLYISLVPVEEGRVLNVIELDLWVIVKYDVVLGTQGLLEE